MVTRPNFNKSIELLSRFSLSQFGRYLLAIPKLPLEQT